MIAGRDLDALIAEKVMGWTPHPTLSNEWWRLPETKAKNIELLGSEDGPWDRVQPPNYSTSIADAWPIADKLNLILVPQYVPGVGERRNGWAVYGDAESLHADIPEMPGDKRALAIAETAPHAICLAALKVVEK